MSRGCAICGRCLVRRRGRLISRSVHLSIVISVTCNTCVRCMGIYHLSGRCSHRLTANQRCCVLRLHRKFNNSVENKKESGENSSSPKDASFANRMSVRIRRTNVTCQTAHKGFYSRLKMPFFWALFWCHSRFGSDYDSSIHALSLKEFT